MKANSVCKFPSDFDFFSDSPAVDTASARGTQPSSSYASRNNCHNSEHCVQCQCTVQRCCPCRLGSVQTSPFVPAVPPRRQEAGASVRYSTVWTVSQLFRGVLPRSADLELTLCFHLLQHVHGLLRDRPSGLRHQWSWRRRYVLLQRGERASRQPRRAHFSLPDLMNSSVNSMCSSYSWLGLIDGIIST